MNYLTDFEKETFSIVTNQIVIFSNTWEAKRAKSLDIGTRFLYFKMFFIDLGHIKTNKIDVLQ